MATLYGDRPRDERVWYLFPYELISDWEVEMLSSPQFFKSASNKQHHAKFSEVGREQIKANKIDHHGSDLFPGVDYCVKSELESWWLPFPDIPSTQYFRHRWITVKRNRPGAPLS